MNKLEEYCARAAEFERLADEASNPNTREIMLIIADRWAQLAEECIASPRLAAASSSLSRH